MTEPRGPLPWSIRREDRAMLSMRELEVFWAVVLAENFTRAGEILGISQPAVSKCVKHAEDVLGYKLFIRKNGRILPSPEAELLVPVVTKIFDNVASARLFAKELKRDRAGCVRVAAEPTLVSGLLPRTISSFLEARPQVNVNVKILSKAEVVAQIMRRQVDLGLVCSPVMEANLQSFDLFSTEIVAVVPADHALAKKTEITPEDTSGEKLISPIPTTWYGRRIEEAFRSRGIERQNTVDCNHALTSYSLVGEIGGVALTFPLYGYADSARIAVRPFRPRVEITPQLFFRGDRPLTHLATTFIRRLNTVAAQCPTGL